MVSELVAKRPTAEWEVIFEANDVPFAPVMRPSQILTHPQALARGMVTETDHALLGRVRVTGRPIGFPDYAGVAMEPPPLLGQHTDEVLEAVLGWDRARIEALRHEGVIGPAPPTN